MVSKTNKFVAAIFVVLTGGGLIHPFAGATTEVVLPVVGMACKADLLKAPPLANPRPLAFPEVGQTFTAVRIVTTDDIELRRQVSGDTNFLHASGTVNRRVLRVAKPFAHGTILIDWISSLIGNEFPGQGSMLTETSLRFEQFVFAEDQLTAHLQVVEIEQERTRIGKAKIHVNVRNQGGSTVLDGVAIVLVYNLSERAAAEFENWRDQFNTEASQHPTRAAAIEAHMRAIQTRPNANEHVEATDAAGPENQ